MILTRLCEVCLTKFSYKREGAPKHYCSEACVNVQNERRIVINDYTPTEHKAYVERHNQTMFVGNYTEGDVL